MQVLTSDGGHVYSLLGLLRMRPDLPMHTAFSPLATVHHSLISSTTAHTLVIVKRKAILTVFRAYSSAVPRFSPTPVVSYLVMPASSSGVRNRQYGSLNPSLSISRIALSRWERGWYDSKLVVLL